MRSLFLRSFVATAVAGAALAPAYSQTSKPETSAMRVALFADPTSTDAKSREAIYKLLNGRTDLVVDKVTTETVRASDFFDHYDVFILPGGTGGGEAKAIGEVAGKAIAGKIKDGKGLIAICAGGYYVAEGWGPDTQALDIINAKNHDGDNWARGEQFISLKVVGKSDEQSSRTMWYENGPIFAPAAMDGLPDYVSLVKYESDLHAKDAPAGQMTGRDAIIAAPYGRGRIVAFGPHPELSPEVNHWLINAIKWSAGQSDDNEISAETVLEGATPQ